MIRPPYLAATIGVPGVGKDTLMKKYAWIVSRDEVRSQHNWSLDPRENPIGVEEVVTTIQALNIRQLLASGFPVAACDTNAKLKYLYRMFNVAQHAKVPFLVVDFRPQSVELAIARDSRRSKEVCGRDPVGREIIESYATRLDKLRLPPSWTVVDYRHIDKELPLMSAGYLV